MTATVAATVVDRPILMSGSLVVATIEDRKTNTRRTKGLERINKHPDEWTLKAFGLTERFAACFASAGGDLAYVPCPYGNVGDRLWVRETFALESNFDTDSAERYQPPFHDGRPIKWNEDEEFGRWWVQPHYAATDKTPHLVDERDKRLGWKPSIHMPRWASRLTLEITEIRVERVRDISEEDAIAEGCTQTDDRPATQEFADLWDTLNKSRGYGWDVNPFVWVIGFRRMRP